MGSKDLAEQGIRGHLKKGRVLALEIVPSFGTKALPNFKDNLGLLSSRIVILDRVRFPRVGQKRIGGAAIHEMFMAHRVLVISLTSFGAY